MQSIKIGLWTAFTIIAMQCFGLLLVYDFFTFDTYSTIIAVAFLFIGYFLVPGTKRKDYYFENSIQNLTGRELSVFKLLAQGKSNKEIACVMMVEVSTIKTHTNNLYSKIGCKNRIDARNLWMKANPESPF